jgi:hypothetical protein
VVSFAGHVSRQCGRFAIEAPSAEELRAWPLSVSALRTPHEVNTRLMQVVAMDGFTGFEAAAAEGVPHAVAVMDPLSVTRLAGEADDLGRRSSGNLRTTKAIRPPSRRPDAASSVGIVRRSSWDARCGGNAAGTTHLTGCRRRSNTEIADQLYVTPATVKTQAATIHIPLSSSRGAASLRRNPLAPSRSAVTTYSSRSNVVSTNTRTSAFDDRIARVASRPSITGVRMESNATSAPPMARYRHGRVAAGAAPSGRPHPRGLSAAQGGR